MADEESQPLLDKTLVSRPAVISKVSEEAEDATNYKLSSLGSWSVLLVVKGTVFHRAGIWLVMARLALIWLAVAILVLNLVEDPDRLRVSRFLTLGTFLNVFVGLLLGFFMTLSLQRWYACADGFLSLMDSIRNMQMQLMALGVDEDKIHDIIRYGILSVNMLEAELKAASLIEKGIDQTAAGEEHWGELTERICKTPRGGEKEFCYLTKEEAPAICKVDDPAAVLWIWVAAIIASLAQDGDIPPMASPTYGRIAALAEDANSGIRQVSQSISVKGPYLYVHLLAWLVHTNNIINAVSFGLTFGASFATVQKWQSQHDGVEHRATFGEVCRDLQSALVSCTISCWGPFIYQALLEAVIAIASPFSSPDGALPIRKFLTNLETDLRHSKDMHNALPAKWTRPRFKKAAAV